MPVKAFRVPPPYDRSEEVRWPPGPRGWGDGDVALLDSSQAGASSDALRAGVARLRDALPTTPVVVLLCGEDRAELVKSGEEAGRLGVPAVFRGGDGLAADLRRELTRREWLAEDAVRWLIRRGYVPAGDTGGRVELLIRRGGEGCRLCDVSPRRDAAERTWRDRFARAGLPSPGRWLALGRALHAAVEIQRSRRTSLLRTALAIGYTDQAALSHAFRSLFRVVPTRVRDLLGWEWLLERWWCMRRDEV